MTKISMQRFCMVGLIISMMVLGCSAAMDWSDRTIYQLLTDRFANSQGNNDPCGNLGDYCGGTFQGAIQQLAYIQNMGFDAIWISPIVKNSPGGYHGYWQSDIYEINSNFGTADDLRQLISACHNRGIWVMLDVVANHVAPVGYDYSTIVPFNQSSHYHACSTCPSNCQIQNFQDQNQVEICRLAGLPDLDQDNDYVKSTLVSWVRNIVANYSFDGLRIDTVPEVDKDFWQSYVSSSGVYTVGEVYDGRINYVASYQAPTGPLAATLSYPLFFTMRGVFAYQQSMFQLQNTLSTYASNFGNVNVLGTFIDNHDQARFLNVQRDYQLYKSALAFTLLTQGIPIIYYGSEQGFSGGNDPANREVLWTTDYATSNPLYKFIQTVIAYRQKVQIWNSSQVQRYADDSFYAFTRGTTFVALTNGGSNQNHIQRTITYHPYSNGQKLCNLFFPTTDCFVVQNGQFDVYLENGEVKIYYPAN